MYTQPVLFEYLLSRRAGLPSEVLAEGRASDCMDLYNDLVALSEAIDLAKTAVSDCLLLKMKAVEGQPMSQLYFRLRRMLYQGKRPPVEVLEEVGNVPEIARLLELLHLQSEGESRLQEAWAINNSFCRSILRQAVQLEAFQNALLLSSESLYSQLDKYCQSPMDGHSKKTVQAERGLFRYLSRMAAKTSPFSTFCTLAFYHYDNHCIKMPMPASGSSVQLNARRLEELLGGLMEAREFWLEMKVQLNPSAFAKDGRWHFYVYFNGQEAEQELEQTDLTLFLAEWLSKQKAIRLRKMCTRLVSLTDLLFEDIILIINDLITAGWLEFSMCDMLPDGFEHWPANMALFIRKRKAKAFYPMAKRLLRVDASTKAYALAQTPRRRYELLQDIQNQLFEINNGIGFSEGQAPAKVHLERLLYEDSWGQEHGPPLPYDLAPVGHLLAELSALLPENAARSGEKAQLASFFQERFGDAPKVPLLDLFYAYRKSNPFAESKEKVLAWESLPFKCIFEQGQWTLSPSQPPLAANAYCAYVQFFERDACVVNHLVEGYGKAFGRFLGRQNNEVLRALKDWNRRLAKGDLYVENVSATFFNANFHPSWLDGVLAVPETELLGRNGERISLNDLFVQRAPSGELYLWHHVLDKRVYVLDAGMQDLDTRPSLFRFLDLFAPGHRPSLAGMLDALDAVASTRLPYRPRVVYQGKLVLRRAQWRFEAGAYPQRTAGMSDLDFFKEVQAWRLRHHLPERVFARIVAKREAHLRRDDYKPQYLDFLHPLCLQLFAQMPSQFPLLLEEALPDLAPFRGVGGKDSVGQPKPTGYQEELVIMGH